jgi:NTE family protein
LEEGKRKKVGLVLGGGYASGLAHIGVLEVLEKEHIPIDLIAGTSMGALIGALYLKEHDIELMRKQAIHLDWLGLTSLIDLIIPRNGFIGGKSIIRLLKRSIGDITFKDLDMPFACVATDIITGNEVIINEGSVLEAIRASISIPVVFRAVKKKNRYLVDGGLVNEILVSVAKKMGADIIIAVDLTPRRHERSDYMTKLKEPSIFQTIVQTMYIITYLSNRSSSEGADVVIHPHLTHIGPGEFHRASECILEGEYSTVDSISDIKKHLELAGISLKE